MAVSVDWDFARTVAARCGAGAEFDAEGEGAEFAAEMVALTTQAEELVAETTGLISDSGPARAKAVSPAGWVDVNIKSFGRLLQPWLEKINPAQGMEEASGMSAVAGSVSAKVGPKVAGAELGVMLGWMSGRVLGQYDLLMVEDEAPEEQDWLYYVAPNIMRMERRYGFPPSEFRLWIAAHECTHRAQFTGVPWLRPYFLSLVAELRDGMDLDSGRMIEALKAMKSDRRSESSQTIKDGGLAALFSTPEQREVMKKMMGLMSLLEGHGDVIMDRATEGLVPSQARFSRITSQRRQSGSFVARFVQRVSGIEGKMAQYRQGEEFIAAVEAAGGQGLFDQLWTEPAALPSIEEIRSPDLWISRMGSPVAS